MPRDPFFGWRVVWGAFVLAVFGWGLGFYGPPIYLHTLVERNGWPVSSFPRRLTGCTSWLEPWLSQTCPRSTGALDWPPSPRQAPSPRGSAYAAGLG